MIQKVTIKICSPRMVLVMVQLTCGNNSVSNEEVILRHSGWWNIHAQCAVNKVGEMK